MAQKAARQKKERPVVEGPRTTIETQNMKKQTRRRLLQGRDFHGWAFFEPVTRSNPDAVGMCYWAEISKPLGKRPSPNGKWIRVEFVPVP